MNERKNKRKHHKYVLVYDYIVSPDDSMSTVNGFQFEQEISKIESEIQQSDTMLPALCVWIIK